MSGYCAYPHTICKHNITTYVYMVITFSIYVLLKCLFIYFVQRAMDRIELHGFQTWTAHAMNKTVMEFEKSHRFHKNNTAKVMILLTDGE